MRILTKNQSRNIDKISIEKYKISKHSLMITAANSIVSHIEKYSASIKLVSLHLKNMIGLEI